MGLFGPFVEDFSSLLDKRKMRTAECFLFAWSGESGKCRAASVNTGVLIIWIKLLRRFWIFGKEEVTACHRTSPCWGWGLRRSSVLSAVNLLISLFPLCWVLIPLNKGWGSNEDLNEISPFEKRQTQRGAWVAPQVHPSSCVSVLSD